MVNDKASTNMVYLGVLQRIVILFLFVFFSPSVTIGQTFNRHCSDGKCVPWGGGDECVLDSECSRIVADPSISSSSPLLQSPTLTTGNQPAVNPSLNPTVVPSSTPTISPTAIPTTLPTTAPTAVPTLSPTATPTPQTSPPPSGDGSNPAPVVPVPGNLLSNPNFEAPTVVSAEYPTTQQQTLPSWRIDDQPGDDWIMVASNEFGKGARLPARDGSQVVVFNTWSSSHPGGAKVTQQFNANKPGTYTLKFSLAGWKDEAYAKGDLSSLKVSVKNQQGVGALAADISIDPEATTWSDVTCYFSAQQGLTDLSFEDTIPSAKKMSVATALDRISVVEGGSGTLGSCSIDAQALELPIVYVRLRYSNPVWEGTFDGVTPAYVQVMLDRPAPAPIKVSYRTRTSQTTPTASEGADYQKAEGVIEIPEGAESALGAIPVNIVADNIAEPIEYFTFELFDPEGAILADKNSGLGAGASIDIGIENDDNAAAAPQITFLQPTQGDLTKDLSQIVIATKDPNGESISSVKVFVNGVSIGQATYVGDEVTLGHRFSINYATSQMVIGQTYEIRAVSTNESKIASEAVIKVTRRISNAAPTVRITSPTAGTLVNGGTVRITADASDSDGSVKSVDIYVVQGGSKVKLIADTTAPYQVDWYAEIAKSGDYSILAVATDDKGATSESSPIALVVDRKPVVKLSGPGSIDLPATARLVGSATDETPAADLKARWAKVSGPGDVAFTAPAALTTDASFKLPGDYAISLTVTDARGQSSSAQVVIAVKSGNKPPTTQIIEPIAGSTIRLANVPIIVNSADPENKLSKVEIWLDSTTLLATGTPPTYLPSIKHTWTRGTSLVGEHTLTAKAFDSDGASASHSVKFKLVANTPPTIDRIDGNTTLYINKPSNFTVVATDDVTSQADLAAGTGWTFNYRTYGRIVTFSPQNGSASAAVTFSKLGTYPITAVVTDSDGERTSKSITVTVKQSPENADAVPPEVRFRSPNEGAVIDYAFAAIVEARDNQKQLDMIEYSLFTSEGRLASGPYTLNSSRYSTDDGWSGFELPVIDPANRPEGGYRLKAVAYDKAGNSSTAELNITLKKYVASGPPSISMRQIAQSATEGSSALIEIQRRNGTKTPVTVNWDVDPKNSQIGRDYQASKGSVTFTYPNQVQVIAIPLSADLATEIDDLAESFAVNIAGDTVVAPQSTTVSIIDDGEGCGIFSFVKPSYEFVQNSLWRDDRVEVVHIQAAKRGRCNSGSFDVYIASDLFSIWGSDNRRISMNSMYESYTTSFNIENRLPPAPSPQEGTFRISSITADLFGGNRIEIMDQLSIRVGTTSLIYKPMKISFAPYVVGNEGPTQPTTVSEGKGKFGLVVKRTAGVVGDIPGKIVFTNAGANVTPSEQSFTLPSLTNEMTIFFNLLDDQLVESQAEWTALMSELDSKGMTNSVVDRIFVKVKDDDIALGEFYIAPDGATPALGGGREGGTVPVRIARRNYDPKTAKNDVPITLSINLYRYGIDAPIKYDAIFKPGDVEKIVNIPIPQNQSADSLAGYTVELMSVSPQVALLSRSSSETWKNSDLSLGGLICDDEPLEFSFQSAFSDNSIPENWGGLGRYSSLRKYGDCELEARIDYEIFTDPSITNPAVAGADYTEKDGNNDGRGTIILGKNIIDGAIFDIVNDAVYKGDRQFFLRLSNFRGAKLRPTTRDNETVSADGSAVTYKMTITEDEAKPTSSPELSFLSSTYTGTEGQTVSVQVGRPANSVLSGPVTLRFKFERDSQCVNCATLGEDYLASEQLLVFNIADFEKPLLVVLPNDPDHRVEGTETFKVTMSIDSGPSDVTLKGGAQQAVIEVRDN